MLRRVRALQFVRLLLPTLVGVVCGTHVAADDTAQAGVAPPQILVMGALDEDIEHRYAQLRPMADYIGGVLDAVARVDILVVEDRRQLARLLRDGRVDWVSIGPAGAVYLQETAGARVLARKWKGGAPQYRSVFFTRADAGIASLEQLRGRLIAYQAPDSTTGHYLPATELLRLGLRATALDTPRQEPPSDLVGYVFAGSDLNATTWVHKRLAAAGVLSNVAWESDDALPDLFRRDFVIFHQTGPLPRAVEIVRADLAPRLADALRVALLGMDGDAAAAAALQSYDGTLRFDDLEPEDLNGLAALRAAFAQLVGR